MNYAWIGLDSSGLSGECLNTECTDGAKWNNVEPEVAFTQYGTTHFWEAYYFTAKRGVTNIAGRDPVAGKIASVFSDGESAGIMCEYKCV